MLPNFTIVICGAILTVMMLAVAGSGLITPETRTRIGEMPEVGRPMMQRMISEPAGQAQFAALEVSRRAEEIGRLRDLAPPALVSAPAPAARDGEPVQEPAQEPAKEPTQSVAAEHPDEPTAPAVAAVAVPGAVIVAAVAPAPPPAATPSALQADGSGKAVAERLPADSGDTPARVDAIEATIPRPGATGSQVTAALADTEEVAPQVAPTVHLGARLNVRLPRAARARVGAKAATLARRPVRHAIRRPHRHLHRSLYGLSRLRLPVRTARDAVQIGLGFHGLACPITHDFRKIADLSDGVMCSTSCRLRARSYSIG
jgi:hypothetical protein